MNNYVSPDSITKAPHIAAFEDLFSKRLGDLPLDSVLVYLIDTVSAEALPYLAEQFGVDGFKGYKLATTDSERREIIKRAIELKRYMGTVYAIRQALSIVGFGPEAVIVENCGTTGNPAHDWAHFKIAIDLGDNKGISGTQEDELAELIREYKNARSYLESISYRSTLSDELIVEDGELTIAVDSGSESDTLAYPSLFYDGTWSLDGSVNYDEYASETFSVEII